MVGGDLSSAKVSCSFLCSVRSKFNCSSSLLLASYVKLLLLLPLLLWPFKSMNGFLDGVEGVLDGDSNIPSTEGFCFMGESTLLWTARVIAAFSRANCSRMRINSISCYGRWKDKPSITLPLERERKRESSTNMNANLIFHFVLFIWIIFLQWVQLGCDLS